MATQNSSMSSNNDPTDLAAREAGDRTGARRSAAETGSNQGLSALFEWQAEARPDQLALVCGAERMTYLELEQRANQMARLLQSQGVGRGDCVAFLLPRSIEVYVVLLGILKAGAAYVPLDPEYPVERVGFILADCQARALITRQTLASNAPQFGGTTLILEERQAELASLPIQRPQLPQAPGPDDLCYIIYTSGTTGRPKGAQIEQGSVCHLVRTEGDLFQVQPEDRVYQGFSIAFDASVEEVWLAFHAGATLVIGTAEMAHGGAALAGWLSEAGVTVLSCVPTLLAMMESDIASIRLLILGGEACPPDLVRRWWKPGRRVVNTYGPTEATVIATYADCHPAKPVTIGRPLPGYSVCVVDDRLQPVPAETAGELCIGGIGLARGYLGRPDLTREKFIHLTLNGAPQQRFYRTGDLARLNAAGDLEFLGRIDSQVKIRGFRVELSEIEAVLMESPVVKAAVVALREDMPGLHQLAGYVVPRHGAALDLDALRAGLRARLPAYMVPGTIQMLAELPSLPSGKVDRKSLPAPRNPPQPARPEAPPRTALEQQILAAWQPLFAPVRVSVRDDFFLDLGGHSLLAARMVSALRQSPSCDQLSMLDVYRHPTIEALALEMEARRKDAAPAPQESSPRNQNGKAPEAKSKPLSTATEFENSSQTPFWRHFLCGSAQALALVFVLSFFALQWLTPYLTYTVLVEEEYSFFEATMGAFASLIVFYPVMLVVPIFAKWLIIGRYRPGTYPLWGAYYFRWWLATTIEAAVPVGYLAGTPWLNLYLRFMGAKIGPNVYIDTNTFAIYDLLTIGESSSINVDSSLLGFSIESGQLRIGAITIGNRCFVGTRTALRQETVMEDGAALEDLSLLPEGARIPRGQTWQGSPAERRHVNAGARAPIAPVPASLLRRLGFGLLQGVGLLIFPVLVVAALFPGIVVMNELNYIDPYYWYLFLAPLVGLSFVLFLALEIAAVKWIVVGKVKSGDYPLHSFYFLRKWFVGQTMDLSLDVLGPLYASIYLAPWYKLLGARLGKGAEISTASFISPDLLSIGDESFIADSVSLGAPRVREGVMTLGPNHIGKRAFIGNSALLPPGAIIGNKVLIGCLSAPPANPADALREDSTWLGSPPIFLPQRQVTAGFSEDTTFNPSAKLRAQRAAIEFVRVITPSTAFIILISLLFSSLLVLHDSLDLEQTLLLFPLLYLGCALTAAAATILAKWVLIGRYRPEEKPLWSTFVWRNELLNALHEHLAEPFLVGALSGTPFICWYFRLLGARIGRRVYMGTTDVSEFDLARIGDEAELNADCTVQTHLFEDRVMKMSTVDIGPRCTVGENSLVLYDTRMEPGARLDALSLLMKGEVLPAGTRWRGVPARKQPNGPFPNVQSQRT